MNLYFSRKIAAKNSSKQLPAEKASEVERLRSLLRPRANCPKNTPVRVRFSYSIIKTSANPSGKNIALVKDLKDTAIKKDNFPEKKYSAAKPMFCRAFFEKPSFSIGKAPDAVFKLTADCLSSIKWSLRIVYYSLYLG